MKKTLIALNSLFISLPLSAASIIDLANQSGNFLKNYTMSEQRRSTDRFNTLHIRLEQRFKGYPVYGANAVLHIPQAGNKKEAFQDLASSKTFMNGHIYQDLSNDLPEDPKTVFTNEAAEKVIQQSLSSYKTVIDPQIVPMIYIHNGIARWAYKVRFQLTKGMTPEQPVFIIDAINGKVYQQWNDLKTLDTVKAGGFGGNHKTGQKIFDGTVLPSFTIKRNPKNASCYMKNEALSLKHYRTKKIPSFNCEKTNANDLYWNGDFDKVATTWSPSNDVFFGAEVTKNMFLQWYKMDMLINRDGTPMHLKAEVHNPMENAYWDGRAVAFGDSLNSDFFNPFTQLDTVAHEICHGFTEQHSDLQYYGQSGGLNEAFSDMAGIAAEYFVYGKTEFLVGNGDVKEEGKALRYMDQPSRDCDGRKPGDNCSIDHMSQYNHRLNVHYSSGIFNRVYYVLANKEDWNPQKAFDVMVQANASYWTAMSSFKEAACAVMQSAKDYEYELEAVANAFDSVGIDTEACVLH